MTPNKFIREYEEVLVEAIRKLRGISNPDRFNEIYNSARGTLENIERDMAAKRLPTDELTSGHLFNLDFNIYILINKKSRW